MKKYKIKRKVFNYGEFFLALFLLVIFTFIVFSGIISYLQTRAVFYLYSEIFILSVIYFGAIIILVICVWEDFYEEKEEIIELEKLRKGD